jgi:hypothetical protein
VRRKTTEAKVIFRAVASQSAGFSKSTLDEMAAEFARREAERSLPADSALIAELAGVARGVIRDKRQNDRSRKRQNRDKTLAEWRAVANLLCPRDIDLDAIWDDPIDFGAVAKVFWLAGVATGVRPIEWADAHVRFTGEDGWPSNVSEIFEAEREGLDRQNAQARRSDWSLTVVNAKRKRNMQPPPLRERQIDIGALDHETQDIIVAATRVALQPIADNMKDWRNCIARIGMRVGVIAPKAGFLAGLSLYDTRHYFAFRAKSLLDEFEVAAAMGHANIASAGGYGAQVKRRPPRSVRPIPVAALAAEGLAAPTPHDVEFVYERTARMRGWFSAEDANARHGASTTRSRAAAWDADSP